MCFGRVCRAKVLKSNVVVIADRLYAPVVRGLVVGANVHEYCVTFIVGKCVKMLLI